MAIPAVVSAIGKGATMANVTDKEEKKDSLAPKGKAELAPRPQGPSLVQAMAAKYEIAPDKFMETLRGTVIKPDRNGRVASNEEIAAFLIVAQQYNLNPFIREIYAFTAKGGGVVPIIPIDGWVTIINRNRELDGIEFEDRLDGEGDLIAITCRIHRSDRKYPTEVTEYMKECKRDTEPWNNWPARMLRHKALIQCARYAFGLAGIHDEDEAERIISVEPERRMPRQIGASEPSDLSDHEKKIIELCESLDLNRARALQLIGQFKDDLPKLIADLEAKVAAKPKANGSQYQATDDDLPETMREQPAATTAKAKPANQKGLDF
jgi:phage recombination protein Bet